MTEIEYKYFKEVLKCLPFNGVRIRDFAVGIHISPQTIYNYINGQRPSEKNYKYILYFIKKNYPIVIEQASEMVEYYGKS